MGCSGLNGADKSRRRRQPGPDKRREEPRRRSRAYGGRIRLFGPCAFSSVTCFRRDGVTQTTSPEQASRQTKPSLQVSAPQGRGGGGGEAGGGSLWNTTRSTQAAGYGARKACCLSRWKTDRPFPRGLRQAGLRNVQQADLAVHPRRSRAQISTAEPAQIRRPGM